MKRLALFVAVAVSGVGQMVDAAVIVTVPVGDAGNAADTRYDTSGYGAVDYEYNIGKYEVTNSQYTDFLNAVADADPNGLYSTDMGGGVWNDIGGISRDGSDGGYTYTARTNRGNRPVNYVSWYNTLRFANWLHNGQPTGAQGVSTTENGAYDMSLGSSVVRKLGALFFLPSGDEWYKAAYYKGGGTNAGYWDYPTQSDTAPTGELPPGTDTVNGSANYDSLAQGHLDPTYYTTEVGAYSAKPSESAYGTFDQGGNLAEWNELLGNVTERGRLGGSFTTGDNLRASYRDSSNPTFGYYYLGFRVASSAAVPETSSIIVWSLLALTFAGIGWRRRRKAQV